MLFRSRTGGVGAEARFGSRDAAGGAVGGLGLVVLIVCKESRLIPYRFCALSRLCTCTARRAHRVAPDAEAFVSVAALCLDFLLTRSLLPLRSLLAAALSSLKSLLGPPAEPFNLELLRVSVQPLSPTPRQHVAPPEHNHRVLWDPGSRRASPLLPRGRRVSSSLDRKSVV